jgi:predicted nucleotidyltransferase
MRDLVEMFPMPEIAKFCRRWKIQELAVFGSVLRADFDSESDIDVIVTFDDDADWSLLDHIRMQQELQALLQRDVDLVTRRAVEKSQNWVRRKEILSTASVIFPEYKVAYGARLSFELRQQHPEIPWSPMAGMRDHLIHGYDVVDWDEVWRTATRDVPDLLNKLEAFLPQEGSG